MSKEWLKVGTVGRPFGLRGAFYVAGREEAIPKSYGALRIGDTPESGETFEMKQSSVQHGRVLLHCAAFSRREHAEGFVGKSIWVRRSCVRLNEDSEYMWADLIGKKIVNPTGEAVATINAVNNYGSCDVLTVTSTKGQELDIPLIATYFDMSFSSQDAEMKLHVPFSIFEFVDKRKPSETPAP